jgi:hypothetical protein
MASECVEGMFFITEEAYREAKELLEDRFGDPHTVGNAFRERLYKWPKIPPRDGEALRSFADYLRQCLTAKSAISSLRILDDPNKNMKMQ